MIIGMKTDQVFIGQSLNFLERLDAPEPLLNLGGIMVELGGDRGEVDDPGSLTFFQQGEEGSTHLRNEKNNRLRFSSRVQSLK
jgi:hypothetical protein